MLRLAHATALGLAALLASLGASRAETAAPCAPRAEVLEHLATRYGESRQSIGIATNGTVLEVFANHDTGTWTILVTTPRGQSCLAGNGSAFESHAERPVSGGDPA